MNENAPGSAAIVGIYAAACAWVLVVNPWLDERAAERTRQAEQHLELIRLRSEVADLQADLRYGRHRRG